MTHGQLITRLCKIRDDLTETVVQLKDAPVEWVKEEPEGCRFCREKAFASDNGGERIMRLYRRTEYDNDEPRTYWFLAIQGAPGSFEVQFCPMCGRDLRGT